MRTAMPPSSPGAGQDFHLDLEALAEHKRLDEAPEGLLRALYHAGFLDELPRLWARPWEAL